MSSKNNWFSTNLSERRIDNIVPFDMQLTPYSFDIHKTFEENCNRSTLEIYEKYDKLHVAYSGGLDSEFVLKTFLDLGLNITPVILDTPYNTVELQYAYEYCKHRSIDPLVINLTANETIDEFKKKTLDRGFYSLLGGAPLVACDIVNELNGHLLTGYGDPFTTMSGIQPLEHTWTQPLEFCEWDYYLEVYDHKHPSGFFTYDIGVFYSLVRDISYDVPLQVAKSDLYKLVARPKMFWSEEFYRIFREIKNPNIQEYNNYAPKQYLLESLINIV